MVTAVEEYLKTLRRKPVPEVAEEPPEVVILEPAVVIDPDESESVRAFKAADEADKAKAADEGVSTRFKFKKILNR